MATTYCCRCSKDAHGGAYCSSCRDWFRDDLRRRQAIPPGSPHAVGGIRIDPPDHYAKRPHRDH